MCQITIYLALWILSNLLNKVTMAQFENLGELVKSTIFVA